MPGVVPDAGERYMLGAILGAAREPLAVRLFTNDRAPELTDTTRDYEEMRGHGYAPYVLDPDRWGLRAAQPGENTPALAVYPEVTFLFERFGPPVDVFGYLIVSESGVLLIAERDEGAPHRVENPGDEIIVRPRLFLRSEYP